jgi:hypothetical protein
MADPATPKERTANHGRKLEERITGSHARSTRTQALEGRAIGCRKMRHREDGGTVRRSTSAPTAVDRRLCCKDLAEPSAATIRGTTDIAQGQLTDGSQNFVPQVSALGSTRTGRITLSTPEGGTSGGSMRCEAAPMICAGSGRSLSTVL